MLESEKWMAYSFNLDCFKLVHIQTWGVDIHYSWQCELSFSKVPSFNPMLPPHINVNIHMLLPALSLGFLVFSLVLVMDQHSLCLKQETGALSSPPQELCFFCGLGESGEAWI